MPLPQGTMKSPNDSLMQSTTLPSSSGPRSIDASLFDLRETSSHMGGGSFGSYLAWHKGMMHNTIKDTTRKLELEQRRLYKVDKDLQAAELEYNQKRQKYKIFQTPQEDVVMQKASEVAQLERHLERAIAQLNQGAADNEELREQIDQLRKERKVLNTVFKTLERGIARSGKALTELVTHIGEDRNSRDEALQKTSALAKALELQRRKFHKGTNKLKQAIVEEGAVQREQERSERDRTRDISAAKRNKSRTYMIADEEEAFSEPVVKRRILKLSFLNAIQRRHIKQHHKNIEVFEQAFATIKSSTGISDIEEIVKIFISLEQRNFSLLTYVNQLNRDIESIEILNKELQNQLNDHKNQEIRSASARQTALSEVAQQIDQTAVATKDKNGIIDDASAVLEEVRPRINNIVANLKQELPRLFSQAFDGEFPAMKFAPPDEQEENLNNHLNFIMDAVLQFKVGIASHAQMAQPPQIKPGGAPRPTDLPSAPFHADDSDDEEAGVAVMSRKDLRDKAKEAVMKKLKKKPGAQIKHPDGARGDLADELSPPLEGSGLSRKEPPMRREPPASSVTSKDSLSQANESSNSVGGGAQREPSVYEDDVAGFKERHLPEKRAKK